MVDIKNVYSILLSYFLFSRIFSVRINEKSSLSFSKSDRQTLEYIEYAKCLLIFSTLYVKNSERSALSIDYWKS